MIYVEVYIFTEVPMMVFQQVRLMRMLSANFSMWQVQYIRWEWY